ncbi:MAG: hypothetical protein QM783_05565 [Phycisphaerales bacterium]
MTSKNLTLGLVLSAVAATAAMMAMSKPHKPTFDPPVNPYDTSNVSVDKLLDVLAIGTTTTPPPSWKPPVPAPVPPAPPFKVPAILIIPCFPTSADPIITPTGPVTVPATPPWAPWQFPRTWNPIPGVPCGRTPGDIVWNPGIPGVRAPGWDFVSPGNPTIPLSSIAPNSSSEPIGPEGSSELIGTGALPDPSGMED